MFTLMIGSSAPLLCHSLCDITHVGSYHSAMNARRCLNTAGGRKRSANFTTAWMLQYPQQDTPLVPCAAEDGEEGDGFATYAAATKRTE